MKVQDEQGEWHYYPWSFSEEDKATFGSFVQEHSINVRMKELEFVTTDAVAIRHDVDHSLKHAVKCAKWEFYRGIKSTYFVLHTAYYYQDKPHLYQQMNKLIEYGHEVGLHIDTVSATAVDGQPDYAAAARLLLIELAELRSAGFDIVGSAAHGGVHTDFALFQRYELAHFGLQYEAYDLQRKLKCNYISDNQGEWQQPLIKKPGEITIMSIHPEHWPFR